ncbi:MAG TPA: hypothetical protein VGR78_19380 [Verrucomicrobiae bacterium]|nr:hypothetical protein [Verrucomicrobiae bacterium]
MAAARAPSRNAETALRAKIFGHRRNIAIRMLVLLLASNLYAHPLEDWQRLALLTSEEIFTGITFSSGQFVAVGSGGAILTSTNALDWARQDSGTTNPLLAIAAGNGLWVALGSGILLTSTNGTNWQANSSLLAYQTNAQYELGGVTFQNGRFFLSGWQQGSDGNPKAGLLLSSKDAQFWDLTEVPPLSGLNSISYINGEFLATEPGGETVLWESTGGIAWAQKGTIPADDAVGLAYGDGVFVAAGSDGGSCSGSGRGVIYSSTNGLSWSLAYESGSLCVVHDVMFANGTFIALAHYGGRGGVYAHILSSTDGFAWNDRLIEPYMNFYGLTYGLGRFAVAGAGSIYVSGKVTSDVTRARFHPEDSRISWDTARVVLEKPVDPILIESSEDLVAWRQFSTVATTANWVDITQPLSDAPRLFFRTKALTP